MTEHADSLTALYWEAREKATAERMELRKDLEALRSRLTLLEGDVGEAHEQIEAILEKIDSVTQALLDEQKRQQRKADQWDIFKKLAKYFGIFWAICFILAVGAGMKAETIGKLLEKLLASVL